MPAVLPTHASSSSSAASHTSRAHLHSLLRAHPHSTPLPAACSTSGPNLRRLYLPGLEGLKAELRKLDFLLERFLPNLTAHLTVRCAVEDCTLRRLAAAADQPQGIWPARGAGRAGGQERSPVGRLLASYSVLPCAPPRISTCAGSGRGASAVCQPGGWACRWGW